MTTEYDDWVGKTRKSIAYIDPWNVNALAAVLDTCVFSHSGDLLPALWHWLYFLETTPQRQIGADGHPQRGDFMPPIENPRRMFAGARTRYLRALQIGYQAKLVETITRIQTKEGSQGAMVVVSVLYEYTQGEVLCISEERDFIYLPEAKVSHGLPQVETSLAPVDSAHWALDYDTDSVLLFRFSALTFNSHRIHTDLEYARKKEGYPERVVHGPLSAILIAECVRKNAVQDIKLFSFRALSPLFCGQKARVRIDKPDADNISNAVLYAPNAKPSLKATIEFL